MTTKGQDKRFQALMEENILDESTMQPEVLTAAIKWISENVNPEIVFSDKELSAWAESNGYKKES